MKRQELKNKSRDELTKELDEKRIILRDMRFGLAGSKSKNVKEQKMVKKDIARILTAINLISD